jgi:Ca2+:H+ antiporter
MCFFAGGMRFSEQGFDASEYINLIYLDVCSSKIVAATQIHSSLLSLSVGAVLLPAAYHFALDDDADHVPSEVQKQNILHMSHGVWSLISFGIKANGFHSL